MAQRTSTEKDYRGRLNRVLLHIEQHLDEPLRLADLADLACFSPYHFHRIFTAFLGEPLGDYVRRLRLERAALHLTYTPSPITELALAAGYETPSAFTRAFVAHFGVPPSEYRAQHRPARPSPHRPAHQAAHQADQFERRPGARLLELTETFAEDLTMTPDLRTVDPMPVLYVRRIGPYQEAAAAAFAALGQFAGPRGLLGPGAKMLGVSHDDPLVTDAGKLRYDACLAVPPERTPKGELGEVGCKTLEGGRYAVFLHQGPYQQFQRSYDQIFKGWLPQSGERLRDAPCFELYLNTPMDTAPDALRTEIWIPLV